MAGVKEIRKTASQSQQQRVNDKKIKDLEKNAMKKATTIYHEEKKKEGGGRSCAAVCNMVSNEFGTTLNPRTVARYVQNGMVGESPLKMGPDGGIPVDTFKQLLGAFESYVRIRQANGDDPKLCTRGNLTKLVNGVVNVMAEEKRWTDNLLNRLSRESEIDLKAKVEQSVEERRIRWTTYANLKMWFDSWRSDLLDLGFAKLEENGAFVIPEEQMRRIVNIDESCLAMDGSSGSRGGRPSVTFYDPNLPSVGKPATKSNMTTTFTSGSNAFGEATPPHFQFSTKAKSDERKKVKKDVAMLC